MSSYKLTDEALQDLDEIFNYLRVGDRTLSTPTFSIILSLTQICQIVGVFGKIFLGVIGHFFGRSRLETHSK